MLADLGGVAVSVVIPTFNRKLLVERAVQSVFSQACLSDFEVIVVDDGSTDGTSEYLRSKFHEKIATGHLRVVHFSASVDPGVARNRGARLACGEFVAFLDSDDWWKSGRLAQIEEKFSDFDFFLAGAELPPADLVENFFRKNPGITSSAVIRRSLFERVGGFPEGYFGRYRTSWWPGFEDYSLWLRVIAKLGSSSSLQRICYQQNTDVVWDPQPEGSGRLGLRNQMSREASTILREARRFQVGALIKYAPLLTRRLAGAAKAIILGH